MNVMYPMLASEIARRGIKKRTMAETIGISERTLHNKLTGKSEFTWNEVAAIQREFFPDVVIDNLFATSDRPTTVGRENVS